MYHQGTKRIDTARLVLRPFTPADAQAMFTNWASDPEVTRFLTWPTHENLEITRMVLADWVASYEKDNYYQWAIEFEGQPIGSISVVRLNGHTDAAELGYCIGKRWWHRGIVSEALAAVIGFLFGEVGLNRLEARHDVNNPHSGAVMRKCGMTYEGTLRQSDRNNQGLCDMSCYGILRCEWERYAQFGKLVRDKIPAIIEAAGERPRVRILDDGEYTLQLEKKLDEETAEFHRDRNLQELADILEVLYALAENLGHTKEELLEEYRRKHDKRGGFSNRIFLISKES